MAAKSLQNSERCANTVGSTPCPSAKLFDLVNLYPFSLVFARFVPIRRFALRANSGFAFGADPGNPLMGATATFVALLLDRNERHASNIPDNDILSREES